MQSEREQTLVPVGYSVGFSVNDSYLVGPPRVFYSLSSGFLCGGSADYYEHLKPSMVVEGLIATYV